MVTISEGAFAKVNLTLDVLGKREDGYHNIKSIMQTISLHDDVTVDIGTGAPWQVHCYREVLDETGRENPTTTLVTEGYPQDEKNLAWKAAKAYYAATKLPEEGLEIFISKRIPMQAGLAGGSADAAAGLTDQEISVLTEDTGEVELEFRTLEWLGKLKKMFWDA